MALQIQPQYGAETKVLRAVASNMDCRWHFTKHALERIATRGWTAEDVRHAVTNGHVVLHEQKKDVLWRVQGKDVDGGSIQVVVAVYQLEIRIKVITSF